MVHADKRTSLASSEEVTPVPPRRRATKFVKVDQERSVTLPTLAERTKLVPRAKKAAAGLFSHMAFAVSYVKQQEEKDKITRLILQQGGQVLESGFDYLFESTTSQPSGNRTTQASAELTLSAGAHCVGFVALIADEHSRKAKYMQALALGLPCISGHWIAECVAKDTVLDWAPFLLCAGQSSFLGNAIKSRTLRPYPATGANFASTFADREKLLDGKSILLVMGKGRLEEKRKAYVFLTCALGPARVEQVVDLEQARKKLLDAEREGQEWDCVYVDSNEDLAKRTIFRTVAMGSSGSRKRKRVTIVADNNDGLVPRKVRVISDEFIIQSLILGQLLEEA